jgi:hypothetical protein
MISGYASELGHAMIESIHHSLAHHVCRVVAALLEVLWEKCVVEVKPQRSALRKRHEDARVNHVAPRHER